MDGRLEERDRETERQREKNSPPSTWSPFVKEVETWAHSVRKANLSSTRNRHVVHSYDSILIESKSVFPIFSRNIHF